MSEKYLRHIRNVVVAAFIIWITGAVIGGIAYIAVTAHDHAVTQENACNNNGGIWVNRAVPALRHLRRRQEVTR